MAGSLAKPLGSALATGLPQRLSQERRFARGLGHRRPRGNAPLRIRGRPAPHGSAIDPEPASHLATGPGLLGPSEIERWSAWLCGRLWLGREPPLPCRWRFVDGRKGRFPGALLQPGSSSAQGCPEGPPRMQERQRERV
jgi:hypothetical protein